jgi:hypothetical protein
MSSALYPQGLYRDPAPHGYPPPKKRRTGVVVGLVVAGTVVVLAAVAAGLAIGHPNRTTHVILTPPTAGGLTRDARQEAALADRLDQAERIFRESAFGDVESFASAVYDKSVSEPGSPAGAVVFLGATIKGAQGGPGDFVDAFDRSASARGYQVTEVDAGPGARGACAQSRTSVVITTCAWATDDSMGELLPAVQGWQTDHLADLMRAVRPDVERKKG